MSERIAALDLGTNTFHLIIADIEDNHIKDLILQEQKHVKLGEGGINEGKIIDSAFQRGIDALLFFKSQIAVHKVNSVVAVGTAALRTAQNGHDFISRVKEETDIQINIIDGSLEAELIYQGVKQAFEITQNCVIMDIGGGSVEFIFANAEGILWKKSYPAGAAKLMAAFHHSDPINKLDIASIHNHLDDLLADLKDKAKQFRPELLIGSAGAFETYAALSIKKSGQDISLLKNKNYDFDFSVLNIVLEEILISNHSEREQNELIIPVRTDMIVVAAVLTQYIIDKLTLSSVVLSTFALKEGLLVTNKITPLP